MRIGLKIAGLFRVAVGCVTSQTMIFSTHKPSSPAPSTSTGRADAHIERSVQNRSAMDNGNTLKTVSVTSPSNEIKHLAPRSPSAFPAFQA